MQIHIRPFRLTHLLCICILIGIMNMGLHAESSETTNSTAIQNISAADLVLLKTDIPSLTRIAADQLTTGQLAILERIFRFEADAIQA